MKIRITVERADSIAVASERQVYKNIHSEPKKVVSVERLKIHTVIFAGYIKATDYGWKIGTLDSNLGELTVFPDDFESALLIEYIRE